MIEAKTDQTLKVTVESKAAMQKQLTIAERILRARAASVRTQGIMITRRSPTLFTVALSEDVPYGLTWEFRAY
ncbi:hypothetical protein [Arthrobacter globiformis]|uniref:hypothetical protein n=1 Tax=Arthrobacter globiformis TaxID=1665 RepID=UPI0027805B78|nr:hypothetical protein [Arthrobacter globiformis]MDQ0867260.1 hypothetical protein [Arthrobacter globiformis]